MKSRPLNHNTRGFTLIELLLYVAITGTLLLGVSAFIVESIAADAKAQSIIEVDQQANQVLEFIEQTAHNASAVSTPAAGATAASLSLTMPSNSPAVFAISGNVMTISQGENPAVNLTNSRVQVSGLSFNNLTAAGSPDSVQFQFSVQYINNSGRNEFDYSKTYFGSFTLRR